MVSELPPRGAVVRYRDGRNTPVGLVVGKCPFCDEAVILEMPRKTISKTEPDRLTPLGEVVAVLPEIAR